MPFGCVVAGKEDRDILDGSKSVRSWMHIPVNAEEVAVPAEVPKAVERRASMREQAPRDSVAQEGVALEM